MPESLLIQGLIGGFFLAAPFWLVFLYWTRDTIPAKKETKKRYMHGGACPICEDGSLVSAALLEGVVQCTRCSWDSITLESEAEFQSEWRRCKMIDWRDKAHEFEEKLNQREELVKEHWAKIKSLEEDKQHIIREADKQYAELEKELEEAKAGRLELANIVQKDTSKLSNASKKINELELRAEDADCVEMYLDDLKIPTNGDKGKYSLVGRVKITIAEHKKIREGVVQSVELLEKLDLFVANHVTGGATGTQLFDFAAKNKVGWCLLNLQALVPKEKSED